MSRRTWQPKSDKRRKKHGFLVRMQDPDGREVIRRRRLKGRRRLSI